MMKRLIPAAAVLTLLAACDPNAGLTRPNESGTDVLSFEDDTFKDTGSQPVRSNVDTLRL